MPRTLTFILVTALLFLFAPAARPDPLNDEIKYSQLPNMDNGWDLQSQWDSWDGTPNVIRADSWVCTDSLYQITDVHWWGSYLFNSFSPDRAVPAFEISIHANDRSTGLPGTLLYREIFDYTAVNQQFYATDGNGEDVYQYFVYLTTPFDQIVEQTYWLDIVALTPETKRWPMWGWHTSLTSQFPGSAQTTATPDPTDPTLPNTERPWQRAVYDLAFELTMKEKVPPPEKWLQLPNMGYCGMDDQSQWDSTDSEPDIIKADDWLCLDGRKISDVHWWGSYYNNEAFQPEGFSIVIYDNAFYADRNIYGPGNVLYSEFAPLGAVNETAIGVDNEGEMVYQYAYDLEECFPQERDHWYWISVVAVTPDIGSTPIWGWHTGFEPDGIETHDAVTGKVLPGANIPEGNPDMWEATTYNFAFALTVPEPGVFVLVGLGALGLLVVRRRQK